MTSFNEKFCRQPSYCIYSWFFAATVFYLLLTLFLPGKLNAAPLTLSEREQFEFALEYLQQNGHTKEVKQFRNLLKQGYIEIEDLESDTNAVTLDGRIAFSRSLFTGRAIQDPESLNRLSMASTLAQVILHELKHVEQSGYEIGTSKVLDLVSDNPAELEGWTTAMQSILDSIVRLEGALATADENEQRRSIERIHILRSDLLTYYNDLRDAGYGEVSLRGPEGRQLNEAAVRRYLEAVKQQAEAIMEGRQPEPGNRATARDKRDLDQDLIVRFQRQWDALEREKDDILAAMSQPDAQKDLKKLFFEIESNRNDIPYSTRDLINARTLCTELGTSVNKLVGLSIASKGALSSLQNDLDNALGIECRDNNELSRIKILFDSASKHAANIQQLFKNSVLARDSHQRLMKNIEHLIGSVIHNPGILATEMDLSKIQNSYNSMLKNIDDFNSAAKIKIDLLDRRDAYLAKRSQFERSIGNAKQQVPELLQLFDLANKPIREIWPIIISRAQISGYQFEINKGLKEVKLAFDSLPHGQAPPSVDCINTAIVEQAFADLQEASAWSILKLAALDEHQNKCTAALAQTPTDIDTGGLRIKGPAKIEAGTEAFYKATDGAGNDYNKDINWRVSSDELVAIGLEGRLRALKPGRFSILAKKNELQADMEVSIFAILPDLRGKTAQNAMELLKEMNIKAAQALGVPSDNEDQTGKVQKTIPEPGTEIIDQTVSVVLYTSPNSDDGGFEDEADENASDSGFSDESDSEDENTQGLTKDSPTENSGFSDESDDPDSNINTESVTYFDRNFMPQSWKTSGNSQQIRQHLFSLGSRLGWAAALGQHGGPPAVDLIIDHLKGASVHVKGAHDNSYLPMKAYKDWQQIEKKHQYWCHQLQQSPNIQGRERQLKTLADSFKSHAMDLAKKIAFQSGGNGLEPMENCDSYYLRIGYYLAYASQALTYAAQGQSQGMPETLIKSIIKDGQSAAASGAQYMQDLKKLKPATGFCIDLGGIAEQVYQGTRRGKSLPVIAGAAQNSWQESFEALGGSSSSSPDMEKIGQYVFADMKEFLPHGLEKITQRAYEADAKNDNPAKYHFEYHKAFRLGSVIDHNPGVWINVNHKISNSRRDSHTCKSWRSDVKVIENGEFESNGGKGSFCLRQWNSIQTANKTQTFSYLFWETRDWSINMSGTDYSDLPETLFGSPENIKNYMFTVLDHLVPRLKEATEKYGTSGKTDSSPPMPVQKNPSQDSKGVNLLNLETN